MLATVGFKIYPSVQPTELIQKFVQVMDMIQEFAHIPSEVRAYIQAKAMYFTFLIQCQEDSECSAEEVAAASVYIAMKIVEKKTKA